jgi:hypothetical protein
MQPPLRGKVWIGVECLKVGLEEGGEDRVSSTLVCGGLDVSSPEDALSWVVIGESESPCGNFYVHAG